MCENFEVVLSGNDFADADIITKGILEAIRGKTSGSIAISINLDFSSEDSVEDNNTVVQKFDDSETMLTPNDVIEYLEMGKNTVYDLFKEKKFRGFRIGGRFMVKKSDFYNYIESECVPRHKRVHSENSKSKSKFKDGEIMLTANDIMGYLGLGKNTAYNLIKKMKLHSYKIGGKSMVKKSDFFAALEKYRVGNNSRIKERVYGVKNFE